VAGVALAATSALLAWAPLGSRVTPASPAVASVNATASVTPVAAMIVPAVAPPVTPPERSLRALLADPTITTDADAAWATIAAEWGRAFERRAFERPCDAVRRTGLDCIARRGTWTVVRRLDLPAILELVLPDGAVHYLAVTSMDERRAVLQFGARREPVAISDVERHWDGSFIVFWKPPRTGLTLIGPAVRGEDVVWLRRELGALDGAPVDASARGWDQTLATRVAAFQRQHRLFPDGIAGEETLARLMSVLDPATPSLARPRTGS
jgi:general secretion pathway protein A